MPDLRSVDARPGGHDSPIPSGSLGPRYGTTDLKGREDGSASSTDSTRPPTSTWATASVGFTTFTRFTGFTDSCRSADPKTFTKSRRLCHLTRPADRPNDKRTERQADHGTSGPGDKRTRGRPAAGGKRPRRGSGRTAVGHTRRRPLQRPRRRQGRWPLRGPGARPCGVLQRWERPWAGYGWRGRRRAGGGSS